MKTGNVYKFNVGSNEELVGIVLSQTPSEVELFNTNGSDHTIFKSVINSFSPTRLKPEVRTLLTEAYKIKKQQEKYIDQLIEMKEKIGESTSKLKELSQDIMKVSGEFTTGMLSSRIYEISGYSTNTSNKQFTISIDYYEQKYAGHSPFVYREYDGQLFIDNEESCIKHYRHKAPSVSESDVKKQLKHLKLRGTSDSATTGDKETLYVSRNYGFEVKNGAPFEEVVSECERVVHFIKSKIA